MRPDSHHEGHEVYFHVPSIAQNFSVCEQHLQTGGLSSLSICILPLGSWHQVFQNNHDRSHRSHQMCGTVCTPSIDTIDQIDLGYLPSELSGRCSEVAGEISPWIRGRSRERFHPLVFRECW